MCRRTFPFILLIVLLLNQLYTFPSERAFKKSNDHSNTLLSKYKNSSLNGK